MDEIEGYKAVWMAEEDFREFETLFEENKIQPQERRQKPKGPTHCSPVFIVYPGGIIKVVCGGSCGFVDRFLGRSCNRRVTGNPDGSDMSVSCSCEGGWFDRIFG